jgi:hypothetical protein
MVMTKKFRRRKQRKNRLFKIGSSAEGAQRRLLPAEEKQCLRVLGVNRRNAQNASVLVLINRPVNVFIKTAGVTGAEILIATVQEDERWTWGWMEENTIMWQANLLS